MYTLDNALLLQNALDCLSEYAKKWKLTLRTSKTVIMRIGSSHPDVSYTVDGSCTSADFSLSACHSIRANAKGKKPQDNSL